MKMCPRRLIFVLAPLTFCATHLLLLEPFATTATATTASADVVALLRGLLTGGVRVTRSKPRILAFAVLYGMSFGMTHTILTVQPAYLFGRVHLPYIQSLAKATDVTGISLGQIGSGWLFDVTGTYAASLLLTFAVSGVNVLSCQVVAGAAGADEQQRQRAKVLV